MNTESNPEPSPLYSDPTFKQWISQIHQIGMEYSIIILIRWAHSNSIFNEGWGQANKNWIFSGHKDWVGPFWLNIQCSSRQVKLIRIEPSVVALIRWAQSTLNIQYSSRWVRLIGTEYSIIRLISWALSALNIQCSCRQFRLIRIEY